MTAKSECQIRMENNVKTSGNLEELKHFITRLMFKATHDNWTNVGINIDALDVLHSINPKLASGTELHKIIYLGFIKGRVFSEFEFGTDKGKEFLKQLIKLKESDLFDHYKYLKYCMGQEVMRDRKYNQDLTNFMAYFKYFCDQERKSILEGTLESAS